MLIIRTRKKFLRKHSIVSHLKIMGFFLINHKMILIPSAKFHLHLTHLQNLTTTYVNLLLTRYVLQSKYALNL